MRLQSGIWLPTLQDSSFSDAEGQLYAGQVGRYMRTGHVVMIYGSFSISSLGTLDTASPAYIAGLPFTAAAPAGGYEAGVISVAIGSSLNLVGTNSPVFGSIASGFNRIHLEKWVSTTGTSQISIDEVSAGAILTFVGHYMATTSS